jgi:murein DD-endopeptidase MepM/ murein hydrolase activator NlpD
MTDDDILTAEAEAEDIRARRRRPRRVLWIALTGTLALLCCGGGLAAFTLDQLSGTNDLTSSAFTCGQKGVIDPSKDIPRIGEFGEEQIRNAAIIINVGHDMKVPPRGWIIAVATAMQESSLINHGFLGDRNDHDSLGLFQQRPSMGWGTPDQIMDPRYASTKFYQKLVSVPDWARIPLTVAAQAVQHSAYPDAYAKHEPLATTIVNTLADGAGLAAGAATDLKCAEAGEIAASGWTVPVTAGIVSGFRTPERPTHNGVDLGAPRFTRIHAAAAGIVIVSKCDVGNCDQDGSPSTPGCGWFVDILHADNVITRYCHMVQRPFVTVGDRVSAGQVIGLVGTSGHSSGPHLHFETHLNGDRSFAGAVNPVPFMAARGAALGGEP